MKHWEQAELLSELLDRHVDRLTREIPGSDWTLLWHIGPFLRLLEEEPILSVLVNEMLAHEARIFDRLEANLADTRREILTLLAKHEVTLRELARAINETEGFDGALACLQTSGPIDLEKYTSSLEAVVQRLVEPSGANLANVAGLQPQLAHAKARWERLEGALRAHRSTDPGAAYMQLCEASRAVKLHNAPIGIEERAYVRSLRRRVVESEQWLGTEGNLTQPGVVRLQRAVGTLHLALITSLARGRSRWVMVKRFAARCESLDRERLQALLRKPQGSPEAVLTLEFARYLFDAGYNPLIDVSACGLRPDVLDSTSEPAIYVEAKQYEHIADGVVAKLSDGLAQTLNTWSRLAKRWLVPEAFLLVFRRSGRPIEFQSNELRANGGRLFVLCVDLAEASESGSRAEVPVRVDLNALLEEAKAGGIPEEERDHGSE